MLQLSRIVPQLLDLLAPMVAIMPADMLIRAMGMKKLPLLYIRDTLSPPFSRVP